MNKLILVAMATLSLAALPALPASAGPCSLIDCPAHDHGPADTPGGSSGPGSSGADSCDASLSWLPRVYPQQVMSISTGYRVWVTPLCDDFDKLSSDGNGAFLRKYIAQNDVLVDALGGRGYFADDVFAVQMMDDGDTINLFVKQRFY